MNENKKNTHGKFENLKKLLKTVHRLRAPDGCPWDKAQTTSTLREHLLEETYEVLEIIDTIKDNKKLKNLKIKTHFIEELGDLLLQILLHSEIADEQNSFDFFDVANSLNDKLIRRHPHVFGDIKANSVDAAYKSWESQKMLERSSKKAAPSVLGGLPKKLPALQRTYRLIDKVTRVGFQWDDLRGPLDKLEEELNEFKETLPKKIKSKFSKKQKENATAELGDLLFCICNLAFLLKINPENALRETLMRFEKRFNYIEKNIGKTGKTLKEASLPEMDKLWRKAKKLESKKTLK